MLSRKKKTQAWLKTPQSGIHLLAKLSEVFGENQTLEDSFDLVGTLLSMHLQNVASGLYVYNRTSRNFHIKGWGGAQEVFAPHQELSQKNLELCQLAPLQVGMVSLAEIDWKQVSTDCFLHAWKSQKIQSIAHLPLTTHGECYGLLLLVSPLLHHISSDDTDFFTVLAYTISLAAERASLTGRFEQEVASKVAQLQESEDKYQAVFEDASEAIVLLDISTQRFLEVNRQAVLLSGYTREELLTMTVNDFWVSGSSVNTLRHMPHHEDLSGDLQRSKDERGLSPALLRLATTRKSVRLRDRQIRRKDGQWPWIALTASSVDYHGEKVILAIVRDITQRKQLELENTLLFRKVNEEHAVYKHLIENVNELVFQVDSRGKIVFTNHRVQYVLGRTPKETVGTNFFSYLIPEDLENARAAFRVAMRHEQPLSGEYRVVHKNGNILTISIYTLPIFEDRRAVGMHGIIQDISPPPNRMISPRSGLHELIGRSSRMQDIYELIMSVAETDSTILIYGESGTGKELIAQAIHAYSHRKHQPFIVVNCAAYSEHLLESELFGHERGAFTGAHRRKLGRFELAKGGTIFLDEVGEIPLHSQLLLLRVLQNKTFERVGGEKTIETDVRIVAATNRKLMEEMKAGRFREDLYYRLNVIFIDVPPLRERKEDIPYLVGHFLKKYSSIMGKQVLKCSQGALELLINYDWYGNVRELEHAIERAVVMASGAVITPDDLPAGLRQIEEPLENNEQPVQAFTLYEHEKRYILKTLEAVKWNKYQAAKRLGITRSTLYSKIEKYQLKSGKG